MIKTFGFFIIALWCASCYSQNYEIVFFDEFEGNELDRTLWDATFPWGRSGNHSPNQFHKDENVEVSNGTAKLRFKYEPGIYDYSAPGGYIPTPMNYTAGMLFSKNKYGYGKYEIRCKRNSDPIFNSAFWLYGQCAEEIDVFEFLRENLNDYSMTSHTNLSCSTTKCSSGVDCESSNTDFSAGFHTFTLEWTPYELSWSVDGEVKRVCGSSGIHRCQDLIGGLDPENECTGSTVFPETQDKWIIVTDMAMKPNPSDVASLIAGNDLIMEIDYIRVWKFSDSYNDVESCETLKKTVSDNVVTGVKEIRAKFSITTNGNVTIDNQANVSWYAGEIIELNAGFEAPEGSTFTADIKDCGDFQQNSECVELVPRLGADSTNAMSIKSPDALLNLMPLDSLSANIHLLPNPNSGRFTLRVPLETGETAGITIYNMLGEKIVSHIATASTTELDITGHPKGMYVVNIAARDGKQSVVKMVYQ